jgi:predicted ferric reductase
MAFRMAFSNIAFLTFLALKNTPLAFLTAHSYETLNPLHQVVGYTTIVTAFTHVIIECYYFTSEQESAVFLMRGQKFGMLAASSLFVILISTFIIKKMRYEVFYVVHISMYILVIVALTQHRPDFSSKEIFILILAGSLWSADRILRAGRLLWNSYGNEATIHPLPCGGTRLVIRRPLARAIPGTHCFLWLPKIRKFETHPFTLVSTSPNLELVINAYDGFTSDLHDFAVKNPGMSLKASVDGPYGAIPDFSKTADKVILIAGGSGASFTFGVAVDMIERLPESSKTKIDFIWTVREEGKISPSACYKVR